MSDQRKAESAAVYSSSFKLKKNITWRKKWKKRETENQGDGNFGSCKESIGSCLATEVATL